MVAGAGLGAVMNWVRVRHASNRELTSARVVISHRVAIALFFCGVMLIVIRILTA